MKSKAHTLPQGRIRLCRQGVTTRRHIATTGKLALLPRRELNCAGNEDDRTNCDWNNASQLRMSQHDPCQRDTRRKDDQREQSPDKEASKTHSAVEIFAGHRTGVCAPLTDNWPRDLSSQSTSMQIVLDPHNLHIQSQCRLSALCYCTVKLHTIKGPVVATKRTIVRPSDILTESFELLTSASFVVAGSVISP